MGAPAGDPAGTPIKARLAFERKTLAAPERRASQGRDGPLWRCSSSCAFEAPKGQPLGFGRGADAFGHGPSRPVARSLAIPKEWPSRLVFLPLCWWAGLQLS